jgi:hypothetical protein
LGKAQKWEVFGALKGLTAAKLKSNKQYPTGKGTIVISNIPKDINQSFLPRNHDGNRQFATKPCTKTQHIPRLSPQPRCQFLNSRPIITFAPKFSSFGDIIQTLDLLAIQITPLTV